MLPAKNITVKNTASISITVYDIAGHKIANVISSSNKEVIPVTNSGLYIVIVGNKRHKVIVK